MLRKKRRLLEMSEDELEAVINVILPGRFTRQHSKSDLQEEAIHWLLANGLRLNHEFTLIEVGDGSFGVLTDKNRCSCCQRSVLPSNYQSVHGAMKKNISVGIFNEKVEKETSFTEQARRIKSDDDLPAFSRRDSKPAVIKVQPLPIRSTLNNAVVKETDEGSKTVKEEKSKKGLAQCCTEFGNCCVSLLTNC